MERNKTFKFVVYLRPKADELERSVTKGTLKRKRFEICNKRMKKLASLEYQKKQQRAIMR